MLVFLIAALNVTAFAASRESENNNDFTNADLISVNETVTDVNADGSVNCVCGQINSSDATFCCACGRRLKGQEK